MESFFHKKLITPFAALVLSLCCVAGTAAVCFLAAPALQAPPAARTDAQLYEAAVQDAITIEADEVLPLVTITAESDQVTWQDGKVLLATVNHYPERYITGQSLLLPAGVWVVTEKELTAWYAANHAGVTDWTLRLKQLVGVPPDGEYTHVTAMWVSPEDLLRPAYSTDITSAVMPTALGADTTDEYRTWFDGNILWSYFDSAYPWTRLGYTYDWADNGTEYGLTEFLVLSGAEVTVEYTEPIDTFIERLAQTAG